MRDLGVHYIYEIKLDSKKKKHSEFLEINNMIAKTKPPEMNWIPESTQIKYQKVKWTPEPRDRTTVPEDKGMKTLRICVRE